MEHEGLFSHCPFLPLASPLQAQIMSSNPELLGMATQLLVHNRGAPRVDLNCGCPANTVTGNGAGSRCVCVCVYEREKGRE
jgi:tRNA-dihydrouridine synthase